jgi:quinol monooxygenase YgiN
MTKTENTELISVFEVEISPHKLDYYLERLKNVARQSIKEDGLVRCEVLQDSSSPNKITILDIFKDEQAYSDHLKQPYLAEFREEVVGCAAADPSHRILHLCFREKNLIALFR